MDKTAIKNFAIWARNALIRSTMDKCGLVGIREEGIQNPLPQSTAEIQFFDAGTGTPSSITGMQISQRDALVQKIREKERDSNYLTAYNYVVEQVAYTWFNRLIAIRFMEVNDYLPSRIRVLSSEQAGKLEPDIVTTPFDADFVFRSEEEEQIHTLKDRGQREDMDALFRILFIKQCGALHELLPGLFQKIDDRDYTQLLLSISFTDREGVVYHLIHDIDESAFDIAHKDEDGKAPGQVEIIGWLYQYYNTEPKAKVFGRPSGTKIKKEDIPAATQLFTPDWIVRYMVENSLGRMWIEGHPNDGLKESWRYYLDEAEQEPAVQTHLEEVRREYAGLNPEDITCIDPCMGSGHILCAFFDVLMQIYESQGYTPRDAAQRILEYNIWGLDIDERAYQLSYFAVLMKARQYDRQILKRGIHPHVYAVKESDGLNRTQLKYFGASLDEFTRNNALNQVNSLLDQLTDAKEYGSLLPVDAMGFDLMREFVEHVSLEDQMDWDAMGVDDTQRKLQDLIRVGEALAKRYSVVCTNPPYMGSSNMNNKLSKFVKDNHPDTKGDLFACFIERGFEFAKSTGYVSMITMESWMFLSSFEKMRQGIVSGRTIINMVHMPYLGKGGTSLGINFGTAAVVFQTTHINNYATQFDYVCYYETDEDGVPFQFPTINERYKVAKSANFSKIPGSPIAYWASTNFISLFNNKQLYDIAQVQEGLKTGDNDKFIRKWYEVMWYKTAMSKNREQAKWFFHTKGGDFRRWYGNQEDILNYENNGLELRAFKGASLTGQPNYFKQCITYARITSAKTSFRYVNSGSIPNMAGLSIYPNSMDIYYMLAWLNTNLVCEILALTNPTINFPPGTIGHIPIEEVESTQRNKISGISKDCVDMSTIDWDSYETSWDFKRHPLV